MERSSTMQTLEDAQVFVATPENQKKRSAAVAKRVVTPEEEEPPPHHHHDEEKTRPSRRHRHHRHLAVMDDSGLTWRRRRRIRRDQRALRARIARGPSPCDDDDAMAFVRTCRDANERLYRHVRYPRESVLDAENTELLVERVRVETEKQRKVARFDGDALARKLRSHFVRDRECGRPRFDWAALGRECGLCYSGPPLGVRCLAGSVDLPMGRRRMTRPKRAKPSSDAAEAEIRPEVMDRESSAITVDSLSATERDMKRIEKLLRRRSREEATKMAGDHDKAVSLPEDATCCKVDGVRFLMNPHSFTQTVENIFYASFLVKKGRAAVGVNPVSQQEEEEEDDDDDSQKPPAGLWLQPRTETTTTTTPPSTQAVVSFTMADWRRICAAHGQQLTACDIPHRTGYRGTQQQQQQPPLTQEEEEEEASDTQQE